MALTSSSSLNSLGSGSGSLGEVKVCGNSVATFGMNAPAGPPPQAPSARRRLTKSEIAASFLANLRARGSIDVEEDGFQADVLQHFESLPSRYALDVNINSLDVLNHKRLLDSARSDPSAVSFQVRPVDVASGADMARRPSFGSLDVLQHQARLSHVGAHRGSHRSLPRPAFGSSPNLQALMVEAEERLDSAAAPAAVFYEVTIASVDQAKLLSRLSESLGDLGLNIHEAHAFNTKDRFALDVFVVNGWMGGGTEELEEVLSSRLQELPPPGEAPPAGASPQPQPPQLQPQQQQRGGPHPTAELRVPQAELDALAGGQGAGGAADPGDDWELDPRDVVFHEKVASGAFGDLFRGVYCGQDVAIKVLRGVHDDSAQFREFLQEVAIMRKVRHRNVVQFIGACTVRPNLCIVFEYMRGGSVYDYVRKHGQLRIAHIMRVAMEVCRGMDYLHRRKIVHRDLKAANLLLDEHGTVKIADFGVARVMDQTGTMTAETGTYRWMAPEVIEHKPYREKADVFSFGVVLWELLTGQVPYADMTPLQAAVGVVQKGLRPPIPPNCPPPLADIMRLCWQRDPAVRPSFELLKGKMEELYEVYRPQEQAGAGGAGPSGAGAGAGAGAAKPKSTPGLLSRLRSAGAAGSKKP